MNNFVNINNNPINWVNFRFVDLVHARRIVEKCEEAKIAVGSNLYMEEVLDVFVHDQDVEKFIDLVADYTTLLKAKLKIVCFNVAGFDDENTRKVNDAQGKAVVTWYVNMALATMRFEPDAIIMMLADNQLTAKRITSIDCDDNPDYLSKDCDFSGEFITDDACYYVYAG